MNDISPDRNISMELARATEAAALGAVPWTGRGDKNGADGGAVDAMRTMLNSIDIDGVVVIGEGEKDEAPMLFNGEQVGTGSGPQVDIAVDPIDGTTLLSLGRANAVSVIAAAPRGAMYNPHDIFYMEKIVVGPEAKGKIDLAAPVRWNLEQVAKARGIPLTEVTVTLLDRPRNDDIVSDIRDAGARIISITDGDVAGAVMAGMDGTGVDMLLGIGGSPEGVSAACAIKALDGDMQCRLWPRHDDDRALAAERGLDLSQVLSLDDLVSGDDCFFALTGITTGYLLRGVEVTRSGARTHSLVMRSRSRTIRTIEAEHHTHKVEQFLAI
ncbi:MAG: class II fructose-bisphosphatase [Dehalococcoidia bacterium]|nr:class II fructose-bisphosphatase [Chloroflexota bacterium]MDE2932523.1 class II fructose-bisphosphatase [Chloroflexota bacterium]MXX19276.1 class II fructose-bisphosphatase [Dehalococcoidia bacterium]MYD29293.1 class II fructose-bisphosphatase [Dehalococcoidia bacterium]